MSKPVVNPDNARSPEYAQQLKAIQEEGKCPFCPDGFTLRTQKPLQESNGWYIMRVQPQLPNTAVHLFLFPKEHKEEMTEMTAEDWAAVATLTKWAKQEFTMPAGILTMRSGDTRFTGGSVVHLHAQYFVPKEENGEIKSISVNYGPYPRQN